MHLTPRGDALHVFIPAGADDAEWVALSVELSLAAQSHGAVVIDVSDLILIPAEAIRVVRLISAVATTSAVIEVACSRLSGRHILRRLLPPTVNVVLPHPDAVGTALPVRGLGAPAPPVVSA